MDISSVAEWLHKQCSLLSYVLRKWKSRDLHHLAWVGSDEAGLLTLTLSHADVNYENASSIFAKRAESESGSATNKLIQG